MLYIMVKDNLDEQDEIIEGEITDDTLAGSEKVDKAQGFVVNGADSSGQDQATALLSLEELIKNHIESSAKLRNEIREAREMFDDSFNNNPTFREANERLKDVAKGKNSIRQQIVKQPSVATIAQKVKDLRFDLNEQLKTLSDLLQDYHEQTGATQIETRDGQVMEIVSTAKLVFW